MRFTARRTLALVLILVMLLAACQPASPTPTVTVRPPATATTEATEEAAATDEATEEATEVATDEATEEATDEATEEPVVVMAATTEATEDVATEEATEETVVRMDAATAEATREVTEEAATDEPTSTAEPTEAPTATDEPTATTEPTEVPTEEATMEATEEMATEEASIEATDEMTPEATAELGTIADIAAEGEDFSILLALVEAANLTDALNGEGPLTVFAPTDEAFEALFEDLNITQDELLENEALADILLYHVVAGVIPSDTLVTLIERQDDSTLTVETLLEDQTLEFTVEDGTVTINGTVEVSIADVRASNGVIHVIDGILIPEGVTLGE